MSYTISNLERHLGGLRLFDRASRKPTLSEARKDPAVRSPQGGAWHRWAARQGHRSLGGARTRNSLLRIDVMLPTARLVSTLVAFRTAFSDRQSEALYRSPGCRRPARTRPDMRDRRQCCRSVIDGRSRPEASRQRPDALASQRRAIPWRGRHGKSPRSPRPGPHIQLVLTESLGSDAGKGLQTC